MSCLFCCLCRDSSSTSRHNLSSSCPHLRRSTLQAAANNLTQIFEELKCPVCFNVCVPPIHNCINGHIICNTCRQRGHVTSCPTCRQSLSSGTRNMFAENFVLNYAQQCCYASQGCEHLRLKGCNMKPHEDKCMFRPVKCIAGTCGLHIPYKNFLAHLDCGHKASGTDRLPTLVQFKYNPRQQKTGSSPKWGPYYIQAYDNIYYVMMQKVSRVFCVWIYCQLGKESDEMEYTYQASIRLKHPEKKISISWHGPVFSIRTSFKTIQQEGYSFTLPKSLVKNFASQGHLNFQVDIKKLPRRSLKGVKLPGEGDSETAVVSGSLPTEYNRPPSFYEPNPLPPLGGLGGNPVQQSSPSPDYIPPSDLQVQDNREGLPEENHLQQNYGYEESPPSPLPKLFSQEVIIQQCFVPPKRRTRTAAIGIPSFSSSTTSPQNLSPSQTSTVTSFLDMMTPPPPGEIQTSNDEGGDGDDDFFGDKIAPYFDTDDDLEKKPDFPDFPPD